MKEEKATVSDREHPEQETVYRDQRKRYPWWVKSVDEITTATDKSKAKPYDITKSTFTFASRFFTSKNLEKMVEKHAENGLIRYIGQEKAIELYRKRGDFMRSQIQENTPGFTHEDYALFFAAFSTQHNFHMSFEELTDKSAFKNVYKAYGLESWQGSKLEASKKIEKAAIALGASQVGFTMLDPKYLYKQAQQYPPEMKYVISLLTRWSPEGDRRRDTAIGAIDNRICCSRENLMLDALRNFIRGLGYKQMPLMAPQIPAAIQAGLGELGRTNRMVSPLIGAGGRLTGLVTDMPLAIDKPIDFGLQEFCRHCKKCADACPPGALSKDKDPTWEPQGEWNAPGKRAYYENSVKCNSYYTLRNTVCSLCFAACPWTKQTQTSLHKVSKAVSAKLPSLSKFMVFMDDLFGYGPTSDPELIEKWWDLDQSEFGLDPRQK
jgi:reductive dehalogenase